MQMIKESVRKEKTEIAVQLMQQMTQLAFDHEYTLTALEKCRAFSVQQILMERLEVTKKQYFEIRLKLLALHPEGLRELETELCHQKEMVFKHSTILH